MLEVSGKGGAALYIYRSSIVKDYVKFSKRNVSLTLVVQSLGLFKKIN